MQLFSFGKTIAIAATTALIMACGGGSPFEKMADQYVAMKDKVVSVIESNKNDLDKAASEVKALVAANKEQWSALMRDVKKVGGELEQSDPEKHKTLAAAYGAKNELIEARYKKLVEEVPAIETHPALTQAMLEFDQLRD